jgi:membrane fusion protein, multidrug efflux system
MSANDDKTTTAPTAAPQAEPAASAPSRRGLRRWLLAGVAVLALAAAGAFGAPWLLHYWTHVSTDDAYVNGHVTYVAPRVTGVVARVLVDDNQFVEEGAPLVELDPEPYRLTVEQRQAALAQAKLTVDQQAAALEQARAELRQARSQARAQLAGLKGSWYLLSTVEDLVRYQIASLRANAATLKVQEANLALAQKEYDRQAAVTRKQAGSQEDLDQREAALKVAREQLTAAEQAVRQARAMLGLPQTAADPESVPEDLPETFPGTLYAVASGAQTLLQLGVPFDLGRLTPAGLGERMDSLKVDAVVEDSPGVQAAQARVRQALAALGGDEYAPEQPYNHPSVVKAQKELEEAELQLKYTTVRAPIAGFVSRREANPGTHAEPGQPMLALRPLQDVWIDANFKETQLGDLCIGQPVELHVDAYPRRVFHGRVAGFSPGTGAALSLLPPENATGNFVKVLQRLTVRIELTEPNPRETPLFVGLSVTPDVDVTAKPTGDNAGERLLQAK